MKFINRLALIVILLAASNSCTERGISPTSHDIIGEWVWLKSTGSIAGVSIEPDGSGSSKTLIIDEETYIILSNNDTISNHMYSLEQQVDLSGHTYEILKLDSGIDYRVLINGDKLELRELLFDGFSHDYLKK